MSLKFVFIALVLCAGLAVSTEELKWHLDSEGKLVPENMTYNEIFEYADSLWDKVENKELSIQEADTEFTETTGFNLLDYLIDSAKYEHNEKAETQEGETQESALFQKGFLENN